MKQILLSFLCLSMSISAIAQKVTFTPEQPAPGAIIEIIYNPTDGPFSGENEFEAAIYIAGEEWEAHNLALSLEGGIYKGSFKTPENAQAIFLSFFNEEKDPVENNGGIGYSVLLYQDQKPVAGAYAAKAQAIGNYSRLLKIDFNPTESIAYLQKEFELYPEYKEKYLDAYAFAGQTAQDEDVLTDIRNTISQIMADEQASEESFLSAIYGASAIGDEELLKKLDDEIIKRYPEGRRAAQKFAETFYATKDLAEKAAILKKYEDKYADLEKELQYAQNMIGRLAMSYGQAGNWSTFEEVLAKSDNLSTKANSLNEVAWGMSGEALDNEAQNLEKALEYSKKSLELTAESKKTLVDKPPLYTPKQWQRIKDANYAMYADTYALLLYKSGNFAEAYKYQKICCDTYQYRDTDMNHRLSVYLEKSKGKAEVLTLLEEMIADGKANAAMKDNYKTLFIANGGTEDSYQTKMASFQAQSLKGLKKEVKEKMINEKAADFTLYNTDGEEVSLSSLKGKVIVLDFWATWCGPCIASFPGMQKAANKYKEREDVIFLFANTWENGEDKTRKAASFIEKKGYDFNILMDEEDKVVSDFGVEGIPTKFVIDKTGRIRFKSVGYQANEDMLINELSVMIELASEQSGIGLD